MVAPHLHFIGCVPWAHIQLSPKEPAMKTLFTFSRILPALALTAVLFPSGELGRAQLVPDTEQTRPNTQSEQAMHPDDPDTSQKTFTGVILKSGDKLILTDTLSKDKLSAR